MRCVFIIQQNIDFSFRLPLNLGHKLKHIENKSFDDRNYYLLEPYGDWVFFGDNGENKILYEEYDEFSNSYTYKFGHFDDNGKFISVFGFCDDVNSVLDNIETEEINL